MILFLKLVLKNSTYGRPFCRVYLKAPLTVLGYVLISIFLVVFLSFHTDD